MILLPTSANDETEEFEGNGVPCYRKFWKKNREIFWNPTHLETSNSTLGTGAFGQPTLLRNLRRWGLGVDFGVAELGSSALSKSGSKQGPGIGKRRSKATILSVDENHGHWPRDLEQFDASYTANTSFQLSFCSSSKIAAPSNIGTEETALGDPKYSASLATQPNQENICCTHDFVNR